METLEIWLAVLGVLVVVLLIGLGFLWQRANAAQHQLLLRNNDLRYAQSECETLESRLKATTQQLTEAQQQANAHAIERARLETQVAEQHKASEEKLATIREAERQLRDAFAKLSADALGKNSESFLKLARENLEKYQQQASSELEKREAAVGHLVKPIGERLTKMDDAIQQLEQKRAAAYQGVSEQIRQMLESGQSLQKETANLVQALRAPQVRGRWGEMQLRRTVEAAGMLEKCDFVEQETATTDEAQRLRPDLIVNLPNERRVVVDAKAPLSGYLDALEASTPEAQQQFLQTHARQIREHIKALTKKAYWQQFDTAPDFVVLFLPGEAFFSAALRVDADLIDYGSEQKVILATPTTLIALLKAVAYGWRQAAIEQEAREICAIGNDIYARISTLAGHLDKLRRSLDGAVKAYNGAVSSVEGRLLPAARKLEKFESLSLDGIDPLVGIEQQPKPTSAPELETALEQDKSPELESSTESTMVPSSDLESSTDIETSSKLESSTEAEATQTDADAPSQAAPDAVDDDVDEPRT